MRPLYRCERRLSQLIVRCAELAKSDFVSAATALDLPVHLARAVLALGTPAPMSALADQLGCDRSYITGIADQLEERELITRVPGEDRRVKLLTLTASGSVLRDRLAESVDETSLVLRKLTDAQRKALGPLLELLLSD